MLTETIAQSANIMIMSPVGVLLIAWILLIAMSVFAYLDVK